MKHTKQIANEKERENIQRGKQAKNKPTFLSTEKRKKKLTRKHTFALKVKAVVRQNTHALQYIRHNNAKRATNHNLADNNTACTPNFFSGIITYFFFFSAADHAQNNEENRNINRTTKKPVHVAIVEQKN